MQESVKARALKNARNQEVGPRSGHQRRNRFRAHFIELKIANRQVWVKPGNYCKKADKGQNTKLLEVGDTNTETQQTDKDKEGRQT